MTTTKEMDDQAHVRVGAFVQREMHASCMAHDASSARGKIMMTGMVKTAIATPAADHAARRSEGAGQILVVHLLVQQVF